MFNIFKKKKVFCQDCRWYQEKDPMGLTYDSKGKQIFFHNCFHPKAFYKRDTYEAPECIEVRQWEAYSKNRNNNCPYYEEKNIQK